MSLSSFCFLNLESEEEMRKTFFILGLSLLFSQGVTADDVEIVVEPNPAPPEAGYVSFSLANHTESTIRILSLPPEQFAIRDSLGGIVYIPGAFAPLITEIAPGDTFFCADWDMRDTLGVKARRGTYQVEMDYELDMEMYLASRNFEIDWTDTLMYYDPLNPGDFVVMPDIEKRAVKFQKSGFGIPPDSAIVIHRLIIDSGHDNAPVELQLARDEGGLPGDSLSPRIPWVLETGWNEIRDSTGWMVADSTFWLVLYGNYDFFLTKYSGDPPADHSFVYSLGEWGEAPYEIGMGVIRSYRHPSGVEEGNLVPPVPRIFSLSQNFPNPFNPSTTISFELSDDASVTLRIYDVRGRFLKNLYDGRKEAGRYRVFWDGTDEEGGHAASGIYLCRLGVAGFSATRKMVLLK
jgi:hypothetical protein